MDDMTSLEEGLQAVVPVQIPLWTIRTILEILGVNILSDRRSDSSMDDKDQERLPKT